MDTIVLRHTNGDLKEVSILRAHRYLARNFQKPVLMVFWPLAGEYALDLRENVLVKAKGWGAIDIKLAWRFWFSLVDIRLQDKYNELPKGLFKEGELT